jgi:hypothetical protein
MNRRSLLAGLAALLPAAAGASLLAPALVAVRPVERRRALPAPAEYLDFSTGRPVEPAEYVRDRAECWEFSTGISVIYYPDGTREEMKDGEAAIAKCVAFNESLARAA